jgi:hypothetical protein
LETVFVSGMIQVLGILVVIFSLLPLILYWFKGLAENKAYMVISIFWMINAIIYAPEIFHWQWYIPVDDQITLYYNLFDAPIILLIFYYIFEKNIFLYLIGLFSVFEAIVIYLMGFNMTSNDIIIGTGSILCLGLNIWGINKYFRKINHTPAEKAYLCIFAGFIFYYGICVDLIFIFKFFHFSRGQKIYQNLINYATMVLSTGLICYGFFKYGAERSAEMSERLKPSRPKA